MSEEIDIELGDLEVISTLGVGGFGRVELVKVFFKDMIYIFLNIYFQCRDRYPSQVFALKCMKKQHIVETLQQEHVLSERNILLSCNSQFITRYKKSHL